MVVVDDVVRGGGGGGGDADPSKVQEVANSPGQASQMHTL